MRIGTLVVGLGLLFSGGCGSGGEDAKKDGEKKAVKNKEKPKVDESPAATIRALVKALNKGQDALAHKRLSEGATWRLSNGEVAANGAQAVTAYLHSRNSAMRLRLKGNDVYVRDGTVVLVGSWIGKHVDDYAGVKATKEGVGLEGALLFETEGGQVTEVVEYMDLGQLYAQIGAVPGEKVWAKRAHVSAVVVPKPKTHEEPGNDALDKHLEDLHASFLGGEAPTSPASASPEIGYWETPSTRAIGVDDAITRFTAMRTAFPDLKITVKDKWAVGDVVLARTRWTGTHEGDFQGWKASNQKIDVEALEEVKVEAGKTMFWTVHFNGQSVLESINAADPLPK
jgi:hypothetical protein